MTCTDDNIRFCQSQLKRFEGLDFWSTLSASALKELEQALVLSAISPADAEAMVTTLVRTLKHNEKPIPSDFTRVAEQREREERAQRSWKPADPPPERDGTWSASQRREWDEQWDAFLTKNPVIASGPKKKGLQPARNTIIAIVKAAGSGGKKEGDS